MWLGEKFENIAFAVYSSEVGNFSWQLTMDGKVVPEPRPYNGRIVLNKTTHCRDNFQKVSDKIISFYYHHKNEKNKGKATAAFVNGIERKLGLLEQDESIFCPSSHSCIIKVTPSIFWNQSSIHRSFFSGLLRAASDFSFKKNNINECFWKCSYFLDTKEATKWFLDGNIYYHGDDYLKLGWVSAFANLGTYHNKHRTILKRYPLKVENLSCKGVRAENGCSFSITGLPSGQSRDYWRELNVLKSPSRTVPVAELAAKKKEIDRARSNALRKKVLQSH